MDLLGRHNAPRPSVELDLGQGLSIRHTRRPRPRRVHLSSAKPYDAREIYLQDQASLPPERWHLASILVGLTEIVQKPPPNDPVEADIRMARLQELVNLTRGRGLDFETHVLPSLRHHISGSVSARLLLFKNLKESALHAFEFNRAADWLNFTQKCYERAENADMGLSIILAVFSWASAAKPQDLFNWTPPTNPSFELPTTKPLSQVEEGTDWIYQRFTLTYLEKWSESSLRQEWLYLHGQCSPPCLSLEMDVRQIPVIELAVAIADKLASHDGRVGRTEQLSDSLVMPAINFLTEGRRVEAAALFEAALHNNPTSPEALNNLGFCLLPDDPERALGYLEKAAATGRGDIELITVNRLLSLASVGRRTSVIDLAATHLRRFSNKSARPQTWLWDIGSVLHKKKPKLIKCHDLASYAITIQEMISDGTDATPSM